VYGILANKAARAHDTYVGLLMLHTGERSDLHVHVYMHLWA